METWMTLVGSLIAAAATIFSAWVGKRYIQRNRRDPVVEDTAQSANVYTALTYTMGEMEADRAYVLEFHNGGSYYSGRGQQKFSCTHEIVSHGISRECNNSQEHRCSNYNAYIGELLEGDHFSYTNVEDISDHAFSSLLKNAGVKSIFNVPIKTLNGKIIGILGVDFVRTRALKNVMGFKVADNQAGTFDEDAYLLMKRQARIIAGYLV